jgi:hypothetical protein
MMRRLPLAFMSAALVYGQFVIFAPAALAVNCNLNACIKICNSKGAASTAGTGCTSWCLQTMQERKAAKQCK